MEGDGGFDTIHPDTPIVTIISGDTMMGISRYVKDISILNRVAKGELPIESMPQYFEEEVILPPPDEDFHRAWNEYEDAAAASTANSVSGLALGIVISENEDYIEYMANNGLTVSNNYCRDGLLGLPSSPSPDVPQVVPDQEQPQETTYCGNYDEGGQSRISTQVMVEVGAPPVPSTLGIYPPLPKLDEPPPYATVAREGPPVSSPAEPLRVGRSYTSPSGEVEVVGVEYPGIPWSGVLHNGRHRYTSSSAPLGRRTTELPRNRKIATCVLVLLMSIMSMGRSEFICGDDMHGVLWQIPSNPDCGEGGSPYERVNATVFEQARQGTVVTNVCYLEVTEVDTMLGFWGTKSVLARRVSRRSTDAYTCRRWADTHIGDRGPLVCSGRTCSTAVDMTPEFSWCCSTDTYTYYREVVTTSNSSVHYLNDTTVMINEDMEMSTCQYGDELCRQGTMTAVWRTKTLGCAISSIGHGEFTKHPNGYLVSSTLQLALELGPIQQTCAGSLHSTSQGLFLHIDTSLKSRSARDIDAGEKAYILEAAGSMVDELETTMYDSICAAGSVQVGFMRHYMTSDPVGFIRAYLRRSDISAKMVGEALSVWECPGVVIKEYMYSHNVNGVCYDLVPVDYEYGTEVMRGYLDSTTGEVLAYSATHACHSYSGYAHIVDGAWMWFTGNKSHRLLQDPKQFPPLVFRHTREHFHFNNTELHSVYGPSGSRFRREILGDLSAIVGKMTEPSLSQSYGNPKMLEKGTSLMHELQEDLAMGVKHLIMNSVLGIALIVALALSVYCITRRCGIVRHVSETAKKSWVASFRRGADDEVVVENLPIISTP